MWGTSFTALRQREPSSWRRKTRLAFSMSHSEAQPTKDRNVLNTLLAKIANGIHFEFDIAKLMN